jgi:hypothetical protein
MATSDIAQNLASMGRNGDSMLMHVQPREVAGLQALAQANGTSLTTNPNTGMPEAFNLGGVLGAVAPIAAGFALGPGGFALMSPLAAGLTVGAATTLLSGGDLGKGVMAGLGGYSGAGFGGTLANAGQGVKTSVEQTAANAGKDLVASGAMPSAATVAQNPVGFQQAANLNAGLPIGGSSGAQAGIQQSVGSNMSGFDSAMKGLRELPTEAGFQAFKDAGGSGGQLAMMGGSALLGGLEESDIYGKPLKAPNDAYDPYATLNLGSSSSRGESGLRLLASGGPVSFAKGGASMQGGGKGAMQGADPITISVSSPGAGAGRFGGSGAWGSYNSFNTGPSVAPRELGLFASQARINEVRAEQEAEQQRMNRMGMGGKGIGNFPAASFMGQGTPSNTSSGNFPAARFMGGLGGLQSQEDINSLNLGKQQSIKLAEGGTIQGGGTMDLYGATDNVVPAPLSQSGYGMGRLDRLARASADASAGNYQFAQGGYLDGAGDGMSDSIPATIEGKQPARLADGEFVIPADVVSHLGNGSTKAGAKQLYKMLDKIRAARTGTKKQGKQINPNKFMPV